MSSKRHYALFKSRIIAGIHAALAAVLVASGAARADGVVRVQQGDGSQAVYRHVRLVLTRWTLWMRTADQKGVLEVESQACSLEHAVQRCLPFAVRLHQDGKTSAIALAYGTIYMNFGDAVRYLPHLATRVDPHEVLLVLRTSSGTYVTAAGRLDQVT
jgi:hypothetical protein